MKRSELTKLTTSLMGMLVNGRVSQRIVYAMPLGELVRGFYVEDSRYSSSEFYLWVFCVPLYVPAASLSLTFGRRLKSSKEVAWTLDGVSQPGVPEQISAQSSEFLQCVETPAKFASSIANLTRAPENLHVMEAVAYSLTVSEKWTEAADALARLLLRMESVITAHNESTLGMKQRAELLQKLVATNHEQALAQLQTWREQTLTNLKLSLA